MTLTEDLKRRILYALLSAVLAMLAARLAVYITNKILGDPEEKIA